MKRSFAAALLALAPSGWLAAADAPLILFPGDPPPFAEAVSEGWFALCVDGRPGLRKISLGAAGPKRTIAVAAGDCGTPLVYMRGAPWLAEREIMPNKFEKQEASAKIDSRGGDVNLWVTAEEPNRPYLYVERDGAVQYFWTAPGQSWSQWSLVWAGDIDGDNRPDFLTLAWNGEEGAPESGRAVFLSSAASPEDIYGVAGRPFERPR